MSSASQYWRLVRIDATGKRKVEEMDSARAFFQQQLGDLTGADIPDGLIHQALLKLMQETSASDIDRHLASLCLRCAISHCIEQACIGLETKYGLERGFTRYDLFPLVLNDDGKLMDRNGSVHYRSLAAEILETFDPDRAGLNTWVFRQIQRHKELHLFLLEHGVYLATDWAILNDTTLNQLRKILCEFYALTAVEVEQACRLLQGYHQVYRQDRLQLKQLGKIKSKAECAQPSPEQLTRIAQCLPSTSTLTLSSDQVMHQLQTLAKQLRDYRIAVRGKKLLADSLDQPEVQARAATLQAFDQDADPTEQHEFLTFYREQFQHCLVQAIEQVTRDRYAYLHRKNPLTAQQFLTALHLFHCQGQSMNGIAPQLGLKAQYQVTRLMNLKEFRASIHQMMLTLLGQCILDQARMYADSKRLETLDHQIQVALDEQISRLIQEAETEAAVAKSCPLTSLLARKLCEHLVTQRSSSDQLALRL